MDVLFRGDVMEQLTLSKQDRAILKRNQDELRVLRLQAISILEDMKAIRKQSREILGRENANEIK